MKNVFLFLSLFFLLSIPHRTDAAQVNAFIWMYCNNGQATVCIEWWHVDEWGLPDMFVTKSCFAYGGCAGGDWMIELDHLEAPNQPIPMVVEVPVTPNISPFNNQPLVVSIFNQIAEANPAPFSESDLAKFEEINWSPELHFFEHVNWNGLPVVTQNWILSKLPPQSQKTNTGFSLRGLDLKVAPNPASDRLAIRMFLPDETNLSVQLLDLTGRKVLVQEGRFQVGLATIDLSVSQLPTGTYILRVHLGEEVLLRKIVVE